MKDIRLGEIDIVPEEFDVVEEMPKISIIMPCLNSARHIEEAVDSILSQTFSDFELIVVDSGSTDGTLNTLEKYAANDRRVRVLSCIRKSMGAQYNLGLKKTQGEYVGFVESDDYIDPKMYEVLFDAIRENKADYVKANFDLFVDIRDERLFFLHEIMTGQQRDCYGKIIGAEELCKPVRRDIFIWNGLYKRDFIERNHIRFNETPGAAFQDAGFVSQILIHAERAFYICDSFYRYRKGNMGTSSSGAGTYEFVMDEFSYTIDKLKQNRDREYLFLPAFLRRYFGAFHNCLHLYLYYNGYTKELEKKVEPFKRQFKALYESLSLPQLSWSDLWPPQDLAVFFENFQVYCESSLFRYRSDIFAHSQAVGYLRKQSELIICGTGENAASVYCYLLRNKLTNIAAFCSDDVTGMYYNKEILRIEEAAQRYPLATYVLTQGAGNPETVKTRIRAFGIGPQRVICYGAGLFHHNWHELPIKENNNVQ
jgi:glycosyltransferase involved in cell wall biosynthesis